MADDNPWQGAYLLFGLGITPSKVNPLVLNDTALWRTASFLLFANIILGELVEFGKEANS